MKYSINGTGNIVAERDIYSLGGFIPKGSVGGKIASEEQLSQEGDCWLAGGNISTRPDVRIKDNAYIGDFFTNESPIHTDGIMEFSGNTLIPGHITVRCPQADPKNNVFIKDSFIGISMDVLCGPATNTMAFPFEQGGFNKDVPKGTLFTSASMHTGDANICRTTANLRLGRDTYIYIPTGYNCRVLWGYWDTNGQLAYSGESFAVSQALTKLSHPVYRLAMVHILKANGTAMTPANLLDTGAKILGHIKGDLLLDIRPESVSGEYVIDNSSLIATSGNFRLATTQVRFLAGGLYNTNMYIRANRQDYKPYGTFRNVERLEYIQYFADIHRGNANRDHYIVASDSPLIRINDSFVSDGLVNAGGLTLRNCIVSKGIFREDTIKGNTYEDIDFSYANEDLEHTISGYTKLISSHKQGIYGLGGGLSPMGYVSHRGNLADTARPYQAEEYIPLDGDLVESGSYSDLPGTDYEDAKIAANNRVRMARPLATFGAIFPSMPTGYAVNAIIYLDPSFIITSVVSNPTSISTDDPYFILVFRKGDGNTPLPVNEFIALNRTLRIIDHTKAPEITGSAYVGAGCTVRGDVKLIGDPYVNRLLDVNLWEWGSLNDTLLPNGWEAAKDASGLLSEANRRRLKELIPVEPGAKITCNSGYWVSCYFYDYEGNYISSPGWGQTASTAPTNAAFAGVILKKGSSVNDNLYIEDSDIPLANVKYLRAFKKRRYITNELDRTSPEDILIGPEKFGNYYAGRTLGETYENARQQNPNFLGLHIPINVPGISTTYGLASGWQRTYGSLDAATKYISTEINLFPNTALFGGGVGKNPAAITLPSEVAESRFWLEFVPTPRIIVPYGSNTLTVNGMRIRMYDNAVLSRNFNQQGEIVLSGDAVMGYDFNAGSCMCSNGHSDAIIKLP